MLTLRHLWPRFASLATVLLAAHGCSTQPARVEVEGIVRSKNLALSRILVTLVSDDEPGGKSIRASGIADEHGTFRLKGEDQREGVPLGSYRIIVEDLAILDAARSPDGTVLKTPPRRFAEKYSDLLKTPLRQKVREGMQTITLDLAKE